MPLSENEQRILREIEEQLHQDPNFARDLSPVRATTRRSLVTAVVGGVIAVAICVLLLGVSPYLAFGAFIAAVAAVMVAERHLRVIGDEAMQRVTNLRRNAAGSRPDGDR
jgi:fatty acid desaturase